MTRSVSQAVEKRDITLALTPTQLLLGALAAFAVLRVLRALRNA